MKILVQGFSWRHMFSFLLAKYLGEDSMKQGKFMFNIVNCAVLQSDCIDLHSHQWHVRIPVPSQTGQHWSAISIFFIFESKVVPCGFNFHFLEH